MEETDLGEFWDAKYAGDKTLWGTRPVAIVAECRELFLRHGVQSILIPAVGYGRNAKDFSENGFRVDGIEISDEAINIGRIFAPQVNFIKGNVLEMELPGTYDAVFCCDILQILLKHERKMLLDRCLRHCKPGGLILISCLAKTDVLFGKGREIEKDTFEGSGGLHFHYADEGEMRDAYPELEVVKLGSFSEEYEGGVRKDRVYVFFGPSYRR